VLLYPALIALFVKIPSIKDMFSISSSKKFLPFILPLIFFILITYLVLNNKNLIKKSETYITTERTQHWQFNFQNERFSIESIVSIFSTLALPIFIMLEHIKRKQLDKEEQKVYISFLFTCCLNTIIVLITARARESRLFALPLILWWPFYGKYFALYSKNLAIQNYVHTFKRHLLAAAVLLLFFIGLLTICGVLIIKIYHPTYSGGFAWGYQAYLFVVLSIIGGCTYLKTHQRLNQLP
jgi:hypothetical protein